MSIWRAAWAFYACIIIAVLGYAALLANVYRYAHLDQTTIADVIIVLGASQWNGHPSPVFQARLDHAYELYREGYAPYVITTGGVGESDVYSEARVGIDYLRERGVPREAMSFEETSRTTVENLQEAARIMRVQNFETALLVSHDFHMMRASTIARDLGIFVLQSPVKTQSTFEQLVYSVREVWTYLLYILFGM